MSVIHFQSLLPNKHSQLNNTRSPQNYVLSRANHIMESRILHISEGFRLLKSVCRLRLKRAWRAFSRKSSSESVKFPEDEMQVPR